MELASDFAGGCASADGFPRFKTGRLGSSCSGGAVAPGAVGAGVGVDEVGTGAGLAVSGGLGFSGPERRNTGGRSDSGSVGVACSTSLFAAASAGCSADFHAPARIQSCPALAAPATV